jgi:lysyl-tRNA synthetase class 2
MLELQGLHMRAALFRLIRAFFYDQGFLEVDTPLRQPVFIPESTIVPLEADGQYLQTSPELCMKRLLARGCTEIFQICPCFRKGETGRLHLEEFTMLEWYRSGADYLDLMSDCEELLRFIAQGIESNYLYDSDKQRPKWFSKTDIASDWQKIRVADAFERFSPVSLADALEKDQFDELLVEYIEPRLGFGVPTFLYDYPVELASLAKRSAVDPQVAERFELYINGVELANGFSELTDNEEQRARFITEIAILEAHGRRGVKMPERFLDDLQNLDPAAGIALGVDRLFMLLMGYESLSEAVTFHPGDYL